MVPTPTPPKKPKPQLWIQLADIGPGLLMLVVGNAMALGSAPELANHDHETTKPKPQLWPNTLIP